MSTIHATTDLGPAAAKRQFYSPFEAYWNSFQEWRKREKLRAELNSLTDSELADIGITRGEIDCTASHRDMGSAKHPVRHVNVSMMCDTPKRIHPELLTRPLPPRLKISRRWELQNQQWLPAISGAIVMPQFDPELISIMKRVLEDTMTKVPVEYSTPAAKAYLAEYILKAAAQGKTSYDALMVAAADHIEVFVSLFS